MAPNNLKAHMNRKLFDFKNTTNKRCVLNPSELKKCCAYKNKQGKTVEPELIDENYDRKYNANPGNMLPVLLSKAHLDQNADSSERVICPMKWGLVPSWFKGADSDYKYRTINARAETITERSTYSRPFAQGKRCALIVNGFYEWKKMEGGGKQPYYFYTDTEKKKKKKEGVEKQMNAYCTVIAGLFDRRFENDEVSYTFTVITTSANSLMAPIHNRMPVTFDDENQIEIWLNFKEYVECLDVLKASDHLEYYAVSSAVNNARYESPECIQPLRSYKPSDMGNWLRQVKKERSEIDDDEKPKTKQRKKQ